jgi:uracil-DNA glycosylase
VDPFLIVALGGEAASTLKGRPVQITKERGKTQPIEIPGAWSVPVLTDIKQQWVHKVRGEWVTPTQRNTVRYLMLPTLHPAFVLRSHGDRRLGNPLALLIKDVTRAVNMYNRYQFELHGIRHQELELSENDIEIEETGT